MAVSRATEPQCRRRRASCLGWQYRPIWSWHRRGIYHLRYFVPQYDIDTVLLMVGVNDMLPALYNPDTYDAAADTPEQFGRIWDNAFSTRPLYDRDVPRPFPTNLALWNLGEKVWWRIEQMQQAQNALAEDSAGENYIVRRAHNCRPLPKSSIRCPI